MTMLLKAYFDIINKIIDLEKLQLYFILCTYQIARRSIGYYALFKISTLKTFLFIKYDTEKQTIP